MLFSYSIGVQRPSYSIQVQRTSFREDVLYNLENTFYENTFYLHAQVGIAVEESWLLILLNPVRLRSLAKPGVCVCVCVCVWVCIIHVCICIINVCMHIYIYIYIYIVG